MYGVSFKYAYYQIGFFSEESTAVPVINLCISGKEHRYHMKDLKPF